VQHARSLLERRFDLLGSGPARPVLPDGTIDWALDWKSGKRFPLDAYHLDVAIVRGDGSDVKVPWELARFQHLLVLGEARLVAPHLREPDAADFAARCAGEARDQIDSWIRANPRGMGVHWTCAMEVALRSVSWVAALALFRGAPEWDDAFLLRLAGSLHEHGRHVRQNLEIGGDGLTSNHFLSDVLGLYVVGCALPELREAPEWRDFGRRAIVESMERQVHPDGVDFERSLPYHRLVAEIFVHAALFARARGDAMPEGWLARLRAMLEVTAAMQRPSGTVPQWGDNDDGRILPLSGYASHRPHDHRHLLAIGGAGPRDVEAIWLLGDAIETPSTAPAEVSSRRFEDAALYVLRSDDLHLTVPCGAVGTRGLGNHGHNDVLSLCLEARGVEWITDPGTGAYTSDPALRNRLRGTAAHATLQLGAREQNVLPPGLDGLFRMEERAKPEILEWRSDERGAVLRARHEGFSGEDGRWVHERTVRLDSPRRCVLVADRLEREQEAPGASVPGEPVWIRYPLGEGVTARVVENPDSWVGPFASALGEARREAGPGSLASIARIEARGSVLWLGLVLPAGSTLSVESAVRSPRYGVVEDSSVVVARIPPAVLVRAWSVLL
jgi:hypothetical protein